MSEEKREPNDNGPEQEEKSERVSANPIIADADTSPEQVRWRLIAIVVYLVVSVVFYLALGPLLSDPQGSLRDHLEELRFFGGIVYVLLYIIQILVPFLPGNAMDFIGGGLFGFWTSFALGMSASVVAGFVIIYGVRKFGLEVIVKRFPNLLENPWRFVKAVDKRPLALIPVNMLTGDLALFVAGACPNLSPLKGNLLLAAMRVPNLALGTAIGAGLLGGDFQEQLGQIASVMGVVTIGTLMIGYFLAGRYLPALLERLGVDMDIDEIIEEVEEEEA